MSISRRSFCQMAGVVAGSMMVGRATAVGVVPTMVNAAARATITVHPVRRNISMLEGSGGNMGVLTGRDGKVLVDAGFTVSRAAVAKALAGLGHEPITHLINTHWHTDHTDGNAWLHEAGAAITAHENTLKHLSTATRVEGWDYTFPPAPRGALPVTTFAQTHELHYNDTHLRLTYYGPAHTDSDISVYFAEADVLHAGDTLWSGGYPFIDYSTGGSIAGSIAAAEANLKAITDKTIVIPGHGELARRADLVEFRDMLVGVRDKVARLKKQGHSLNETIAAQPTAAYDAKWGHFLTTPAAFTRLVYQGV